MTDYDCTNDVLEHRERVAFWINWVCKALEYRAIVHDKSKLLPPEKEIFDEYTPKLKILEFGGEEYKKALERMGEGLKHHYQQNGHHPEHYKDGINGMDIIDLVEMLADWIAAASVKGSFMDLDYLQKRFNIPSALINIFANTLFDIDMDDINFRIPEEFQSVTNLLDPHFERIKE